MPKSKIFYFLKSTCIHSRHVPKVIFTFLMQPHPKFYYSKKCILEFIFLLKLTICLTTIAQKEYKHFKYKNKNIITMLTIVRILRKTKD